MRNLPFQISADDMWVGLWGWVHARLRACAGPGTRARTPRGHAPPCSLARAHGCGRMQPRTCVPNLFAWPRSAHGMRRTARMPTHPRAAPRRYDIFGKYGAIRQIRM